MEQNFLSWDSDFFGKKISRIKISEFEGVDQVKKIPLIDADLCYVSIPENHPKVHGELIKIGGILYDRKVTYERLVSSSSIKNDYKIEELKYISTEVEEMAYQSGVYSRFNLDPLLKPKYKDLYYQWIVKSINKEMADKVLLAKSENGVSVGFITLITENKKGKIGLIAVDARFRGKGVGTSLLAGANNYFYKTENEVIEVITQLDNIPACSLYEKAGFKKKSIENIYHYWRQ